LNAEHAASAELYGGATVPQSQYPGLSGPNFQYGSLYGLVSPSAVGYDTFELGAGNDIVDAQMLQYNSNSPINSSVIPANDTIISTVPFNNSSVSIFGDSSDTAYYQGAVVTPAATYSNSNPYGLSLADELYWIENVSTESNKLEETLAKSVV
jgi:hypothetical protein